MCPARRSRASNGSEVRSLRDMGVSEFLTISYYLRRAPRHKSNKSIFAMCSLPDVKRLFSERLTGAGTWYAKLLHEILSFMKNLFSPIIASLLVGAFLGLAVPANAVPVVGPTGHFYDVIAGPGLAWADANAAANASSYLGLPGHLVTITGAPEDVFIDTLRNTLSFGEVWVGGFQNPTTETVPGASWTWVNGEGSFPGVNSVSPYANWTTGEPNDFYGLASEQYLAIGLSGLGGGWNDEGAIGLISGYAVEYEAAAVPEQGSLTLVSVLTFAGLFVMQAADRRAWQSSR